MLEGVGEGAGYDLSIEFRFEHEGEFCRFSSFFEHTRVDRIFATDNHCKTFHCCFFLFHISHRENKE